MLSKFPKVEATSRSSEIAAAARSVDTFSFTGLLSLGGELGVEYLVCNTFAGDTFPFLGLLTGDLGSGTSQTTGFESSTLDCRLFFSPSCFPFFGDLLEKREMRKERHE